MKIYEPFHVRVANGRAATRHTWVTMRSTMLMLGAAGALFSFGCKPATSSRAAPASAQEQTAAALGEVTLAISGMT